MLYAEGDNYRFEVEAGHAYCKVWRRPDLDSSAGADLAEEKIQLFVELAEHHAVHTLLLDLRVAPSFVGPRTQRALGEAFHAFERARKPLGVVTASAVQGLQVQRLLALHAPLSGRDFHDFDQAKSWLRSYRER